MGKYAAILCMLAGIAIALMGAHVWLPLVAVGTVIGFTSFVVWVWIQFWG